jgi:hypothetical protein
MRNRRKVTTVFVRPWTCYEPVRALVLDVSAAVREQSVLTSCAWVAVMNP